MGISADVHLTEIFCGVMKRLIYHIFHQVLAGWWGTAVAQWLGRCATIRKVAGSIPTGVIGIFH